MEPKPAFRPLRPLKELLGATLDLGGGAVALWLRLFPQLASIYLGGWLLTELSVRITTQIPLDYVYLALLVFALGFLFTLGAIVLMLRLVAQHLDVWSLVDSDDTDHSVSHILAITLLPFLGIYAAVNEVAARADQLTALGIMQTGIVADRTIISELNPFNGEGRVWIVVGLLVGAYVVRRIVDLVHEKTGWRLLGILVAVFEAYFLLVLIMSGTALIKQLQDWWETRVVVQWLDQAGSAIGGFLDQFDISWPFILTWLGTVLSTVIWPLLRDALVQPVIWLAVAALVFGSRVLSVADLWRRGQPLTAQVPVPKRLQRLQAHRARKSGSRGFRRVWLEFQELFLGDIDDKYLPTLQSMRLILRAGLTFLGAYVLVYALWTGLSQLYELVVMRLVGGHDVIFWSKWGTLTDIVVDVPLETLRMCLLALAFHRCLQMFHDRASGVRR
ncbi:hypothetical protein ACQBAU_00035 [Propionibacteriaceae bacterium Y2011]